MSRAGGPGGDLPIPPHMRVEATPSQKRPKTLGALRRAAVLARAPHRPVPALPAPVDRPTLGALRAGGTAGTIDVARSPERARALDDLSWSIAVDAARTIDALVARGWTRDEAARTYVATITDLADRAARFGAEWSWITAA